MNKTNKTIKIKWYVIKFSIIIIELNIEPQIAKLFAFYYLVFVCFAS